MFPENHLSAFFFFSFAERQKNLFGEKTYASGHKDMAFMEKYLRVSGRTLGCFPGNIIMFFDGSERRRNNVGY